MKRESELSPCTCAKESSEDHSEKAVIKKPGGGRSPEPHVGTPELRLEGLN